MTKIFWLLFIGAVAMGAYKYQANDPSMRWAHGLVAQVSPDMVNPGPAVVSIQKALAGDQKAPPWSPPAVIPAHAGWTWATDRGTYHNVRILRIDSDSVTILHDDGGGRVALNDLPRDVQAELNYTPVAEPSPVPADASTGRAMIIETPAEADTYEQALDWSKKSGKHMLLHFTGSDWCPACQMLDRNVISTSEFQQFVRQNFITVTFDFPRHSLMLDETRARNQAVAAKFGVTGYPTLLVVDGNEQVCGRIVGCPMSGGPAPIIETLGNALHN